MRKIVIIVLMVAVLLLVGCKSTKVQPDGAKHSEKLFAVTCANSDGTIVKILKVPCTIDADCALENLEAECSDGSIALPSCGPKLVCEEGLCKIKCALTG